MHCLLRSQNSELYPTTLSSLPIADYDSYTHNESAHTAREANEILMVEYEDGTWSKPYYDCGGANIWMITYTVPFFGFRDGNYFFK